MIQFHVLLALLVFSLLFQTLFYFIIYYKLSFIISLNPLRVWATCYLPWLSHLKLHSVTLSPYSVSFSFLACTSVKATPNFICYVTSLFKASRIPCLFLFTALLPITAACLSQMRSSIHIYWVNPSFKIFHIFLLQEGFFDSL